MAHESQQRVWRLTRQLEAGQQPLYFPHIKRREHGLVGSNDMQAFSSLWKMKLLHGMGFLAPGVALQAVEACNRILRSAPRARKGVLQPTVAESCLF